MPEILNIATLFSCFAFILLLLRLFGCAGMYVYTSIAVIASNIQVLKLTQYSFLDTPVALGTVVFSTIFAVDNILTEYYGPKIARKCVWISFLGYLFFALVMKIEIMHPFVQSNECLNMHYEIQKLFSPSFVLFVASIISYVVSQLIDIHVFTKLKNAFAGKNLHLRSFITLSISMFVDNCIFSLCAWVIFADNPITLSSLFTTYIFITYIMRLVIALMCVPLVKLAGLVIIKEADV